ncbi:hypothetical protein HZS_555 [Henneguya salminicola]|nr:hypothetical protein HZS_555 [Henneguya salminicola]
MKIYIKKRYERDITDLAVDKLTALLKQIQYCNGQDKWKIADVIISGVSVINIRKGNVKNIYDFDLTLEFESEIDDQIIKGKIEIPEFSFDTKAEDINYTVRSETKTENTEKLYKCVKTTCLTLIKAKLVQFIQFQDEFIKSIKLPQKPDNTQKINVKTQNNVIENPAPILGDTQNIELTEFFDCSVFFLFEIFTHVDKIRLFTHSNATFEPFMGGRFSFLNDSITGKVLEIVPNEKLVLSWRFSNWPADFFSNVQLFFTDNADSRSCLKLKHDNILSEDKERVSIGWPNIFFKPICRAFQIGPHNVQFSIF